MRMMKKLCVAVLFLSLLLTLTALAFATVADTGFSDVDADAWYTEAVMYCREHGLMNGTTNTTFAPDSSLTRAMLVTVLYRMAGSPAVLGIDAFSDTIPGAYYSDAVLWASQQGVVGGYGNGLFGTNDPVSREQMTTILWRYAGSPAAEEHTGNFTDRDETASYAVSAVDWASANGIVRTVSSNVFAPKGSATRAQVADALMNYSRDQQTTPAPSRAGKVLVAYFSRYGNTDYDSDVDAATSASVTVQDGQRQGTTELIANETNGDLHLIETEETYPADFNDVVDQNHQESADGTRPNLTSRVDMDSYDVIFAGYPVWASTTPTPVLSFLESYDLSGKTVIPFCTHDGYGAGSSYSAVSHATSGATVGRGLAIEASDAPSSESTVKNWLNGLDLPASGSQNSTQGETAIRITIGDIQLDGLLYDSDMAKQFMAQLPQTISMSNYGGREVYGGVEQRITVEGEGQLRFDDGDITYCPSNNTAAIFYAQTDRPNLTMEVYPIGKVTSDLSVFPGLPSRVDVAFEIIR